MFEKKVPVHKFPGIIVFLLVFFSVQISITTPNTKSINNLIQSNPENGTLKLTIDADGGINPGQGKYVDNPSRLFFDLPDTVLKYNNGRTKKIQVDSGDLNGIAISQYQTNPDIVRIVLYFNGCSESDLRNAVKTNVDGNRFIISYSKTNKIQPPPTIKPSVVKKTTDFNRINKILYKNVGTKADRFVFQASGNFDNPDVKITEKGVTLNFPQTLFKIPSGHGDDFSVPVNSDVIDKVEVNNQSTGAVVFLSFDESAKSHTFNYDMDSHRDNELIFELTWGADSTGPQNPDIKPPATTSKPIENELVNLFQSTAGTKIPPAVLKAGSSISKIQYVPLSLGERFIFTATGEFNPEIQNIQYPDRLSVKATNTSVILPRDAEDKYQIKIDGALSNLMRVFQREVDGVCESSILFYYETGENELVHYKFYKTEQENIYHLDLIPYAVEGDIPKIPFNTEINDTKKTEDSSEHVTVEKAEDVAPFIEPTQPSEPITDNSEVTSVPIADDGTKESLVDFKIPVKEEVSTIKAVEIPPAPDSLNRKSIPDQPESTMLSKPETVPLPSIRISYVEGENVDTFNFTCDEPIQQYRYSVLNNPARLVLEFYNREIELDSTQNENIRYVDGKATEMLRISDNDGTNSWTQLHIYLKYPWDNLECSLSRALNTDKEIECSDLSFSIELKPLI